MTAAVALALALAATLAPAAAPDPLVGKTIGEAEAVYGPPSLSTTSGGRTRLVWLRYRQTSHQAGSAPTTGQISGRSFPAGTVGSGVGPRAAAGLTPTYRTTASCRYEVEAECAEAACKITSFKRSSLVCDPPIPVNDSR